MPSSSHKKIKNDSVKSSGASSSTRDSRRSRRSTRSSADSYGSKSTTPTSANASPRPSEVKASRSSRSGSGSGPKFQPSYESYEEDLSPATNCHPRASNLTYASTTPSEEDLTLTDSSQGTMDYDYALPSYRRETAPDQVRPSTPQEFARLFPSTNCLSIRHDDFTDDGNMNLRVDAAIPGRKRHMMQLFHLRMYDLSKREFSLRRYCRDSGREVCNSKRKYDEPAAEERPTLQRSVTSAIKTLGARPGLRRANTGGSLFSSSPRRPGTSYSSCDADDEFAHDFGRSLSADKKARATATNTIKLEFSNYARVDVQRKGSKGSKRYDFSWWGHKYSWRRSTEKHTDVVSFHLLRDGKDKSIAHIVPETRTPDQILAERAAGGWIPPCQMYITDKNTVKALTDVAE